MLKFCTNGFFYKKIVFFKFLFFFKFFFKKKNKIKFKVIKAFKPLFKLVYRIKMANFFKLKMGFSFINNKYKFIFSFFKKIMKINRFFFFLKNTTCYTCVFFIKKNVSSLYQSPKKKIFFKKFLLNSYNSKTFNWLFTMFKLSLIISSLFLFNFLLILHLFLLFGFFGLIKVFFNKNNLSFLKLRFFIFFNVKLV